MLSGCSSTPPAQITQQQLAAEKVDATTTTLKTIPEWYLQVPEDGYGIYGAGTAVSEDLQFAIDKARLMANHKIGETYDAKLSALSKSYAAEGRGNGAHITGESSSVVESFTKNADVSGTKVIKTEVLQEQGRVRAYVLTYLPLGETNMIKLVKQEEANQQASHENAKAAHEELRSRASE